jgi:hypothetical protein
VVLVAVALGVAGLLLSGSGDGLFGETDGDDPAAEEPAAAADDLVPIARSVDFDPGGDGREHPDEAEAGNVFDNDAGTSWSSETYGTPEWGGLKPGVGIILDLEESADLRSLSFDTPLAGWQAQVYVSDEAYDALEDWGEPVATLDEGSDGTATVEIQATGSSVLLWFTRAGDGNLVKVEEVRISR